MKYRKKPVVIEAVKWTGFNKEEIQAFAKGRNVIHFHGVKVGSRHEYIGTYYELYIDTLEGRMFANKGDYIIKGVDGEFYPCKPDIFEKTYEVVE